MTSTNLPINGRTFAGQLLLLILAANLLSHASRAQESLGGLAFVNMIASTNRSSVTVNGKSISNQGLEFGQATSVLGFPQGPTVVEVANGTNKPATLSVEVSGAASPIIVCWLQPSDEETKEVRIGKINNSSERGPKSFRVLYLGGLEPVSVFGANQLLATVSPDKIQKLTASSEQLADFRVEGGDAFDVSREEAGNYLILITPDHTGPDKYKVVCVSDYIVKSE